MALALDHSIDWGNENWRDYAACKDSNPELFFPIGNTGLAIYQIQLAKEICNQCLAEQACLEFALATNQESGVWGGTAEDERRNIRKAWMSRQHHRSFLK